jgi:large subunit ribosomal protein L3
MTPGIIGKKLGMTQIYQASGQVEPVTLIQAGPCVVVQVKTAENDGYRSAQLGFGESKRINSPEKGHAKGVGPFKFLREFRLEESETAEVGQKIDVSLFQIGDKVNVIGISKGKGFAGGVKRYHFHGGPKTHGQSDRWRAPGSVGSNTTPGRVFKGLRMAGHMGSQRVTASNLTVLQSDPARNLILIIGAVPGAANGMVLVQKSRKGKK